MVGTDRKAGHVSLLWESVIAHGHRDRRRRLDVLASEPSGYICVAAVALITLIIFMIPALEAASWNAGRPAQD
jgi:hypothetical protein